MIRILFLLVTLSFQVAGQQKFEITPQSRITWRGSMVVGGGHVGTLTATAGSFTILPDGKITKSAFTIDMNSIRSTDMKAGKSARELEDHLKSSDFFAVDKFPSAFFTILKMTPAPTYPNKDTYTITGILIIKGLSNQVTFPGAVVIGRGMATVKAEMQFDRTKWDILYHSANLFDTAKNELISDQIKISLDLIFVEKK